MNERQINKSFIIRHIKQLCDMYNISMAFILSDEDGTEVYKHGESNLFSKGLVEEAEERQLVNIFNQCDCVTFYKHDCEKSEAFEFAESTQILNKDGFNWASSENGKITKIAFLKGEK